MHRTILIPAIIFIAIGVVGLVALNAWPWDTYGMMSPGTMGYAYGYGTVPGIAPVTLDQAVTGVQMYVASFNNPDLVPAEVMEFSNNFYIRVKEQSTGVNAFEILVSRNGGISPEPGPNMMWNVKHSPMANMIGGWFMPSSQNSVTASLAKEKAQQYLDTYLNGATVADNADAFYGYYTIDVLRDGKPFGMLSVNGTTGAVWYHTWNGGFIREKEIQ